MANSNYQRYFWTATYVIVGVVIGIILVSFFAYYHRFSAFLLLVWSFAFIVIGGLVGFIFSVPKIISETVSGVVDRQKVRAGDNNRVEENTNLTQISDWLTKILIGAGLVEIKEAPRFVLHVARVMAQGVRTTPASLQVNDAATIMCAGILLYFITWGFISGYLIMRLVLTDQFANRDRIVTDEIVPA